MRPIVLVLAACLMAANAAPNRIVGGTETTIDLYPFVTVLLYSFSSSGSYLQSCVGTILNNKSILTAAHCTSGSLALNWRARVGSTLASSGGTVVILSSIINHPNYNSATVDNDVSIIRTSVTMEFGTNVGAGSIAGSSYTIDDDVIVWAIGWGTTSFGGSLSEQLRHVQIWTINQAVCRERYGTSAITDNMLCSGWLDVGGRDQCQGDSGGPLLHNGVVVGVCSWGYGCADSYYPGVNARVSRFTSWINSTLNNVVNEM